MKKITVTLVAVMILFSSKMTVNAAGLKDIFSPEYYADSYKDLYNAFEYDETKLFNHVKEYGLKEKRDISPILDVVYYRETYPDLNAAFGDNWDLYVNHYFEYGIKEGRDNGTDFDIIRYVNSYADLRQAFGEDYEALAKHYIEYGMKENRTMALKLPECNPTGKRVEYGAYDKAFKELYYTEDGSGTLIHYYLYDYDSNGLIKKKTNYNADGSVIAVEVFEHKSNGTYIGKVSEGNNVTKTILYNKNGNPIKVTFHNDPIITYIEYEYDGNILVREKKITVNGICQVIEYDLLTQKKKTEMDYNSDGYLLQYVVFNSNEKQEQAILYDFDGNVIRVDKYIYDGKKLIEIKMTYSDNSYVIYDEFDDWGANHKCTYYRADGTIYEIREYIYKWVANRLMPAEERIYRANGTLRCRIVLNEDGTIASSTEYDENENPI